MFRSKSDKKQHTQHHESDLIINLNRESFDEDDDSGKKDKEKKGWKFSALIKMPVGWLRIFRGRRDKGVEFVRRWEELEKKDRKKKGGHSPGLVYMAGVIVKGIWRWMWRILKIVIFVIKAIFRIRKKKKKGFLNLKKEARGKNKAKSKKRKKDKKEGEDKDHGMFLSGIYKSNKTLFRSLVSFFLFLLLIILPFKALDYYTSFDLGQFKGRVLGTSEKALYNFKNAAKALTKMDTKQANKNFSEASSDFMQAQKQVEQINGLLLELSRFAPQKEIRMASESDNILAAGHHASQLGENLTSAFDTLSQLQQKEKREEGVMRIINDFSEELDQAILNVEKLNKEVQEIDSKVLPAKYRSKFVQLKEKSQGLKKGLEELALLTEKSKIFLGSKYDKKYLLIFQNSNEIRASGGFAGSFAMMEFGQGKLKNIEIPPGGSYDLDGGMRELMAAPRPLRLVSRRWYFRDANWWPDWPTSARNMMSFYEKSGGPTVDGCISFTPEVLGEFLEITGPLDMKDKYGIIINKDNYWTTIRQQIEKEKSDSDNDHKPKKIIRDMAHRLIKKLSRDLDREKMVELLSATRQNLEGKNIQFYFRNEELQQEVEDRGWGGRIKNAPKDYFFLVNSNIAGKKSDKNIDQKIYHRAEVQTDGSIVDTVKIIRTHKAETSSPKYYRARNVNWMRVYTPQGSELLEAGGFERPSDIFFEQPGEEWKIHPKLKRQYRNTEFHRDSGTRIYPENNKTVFANWTILDPGETNIIHLKYRLPFKVQPREEPSQEWWWQKAEDIFSKKERELSSYSLMIQNQAGSEVEELNSLLLLPQQWRPIWEYPREIETTDRGWSINRELERSRYWGVILERK